MLLLAWRQSWLFDQTVLIVAIASAENMRIILGKLGQKYSSAPHWNTLIHKPESRNQ
jgi:hypothetical protein